MKLNLLVFPSVDKLIRFKIAIDPKILELNLKTKTIFCYCTEDETELASYVYDAGILEMQPSLS
jgi:hypothetical protein